MKKLVFILSLFLFLGVFNQIASAATSSFKCNQNYEVKKVLWDGVELTPGQIGKLVVLKSTSLFKLDGVKKIYIRTLQVGDVYKIYAFKLGMLNVGGGYYVEQDARVRYQTPSKLNLDAVKCNAMQGDLLRGFNWNTTQGVVKGTESGDFVKDYLYGNFIWTTYSIPKKYNMPTNVTYEFNLKESKLSSIEYSFTPNKAYQNRKDFKSLLSQLGNFISKDIGAKMRNRTDNKYVAGDWKKDGIYYYLQIGKHPDNSNYANLLIFKSK